MGFTAEDRHLMTC